MLGLGLSLLTGGAVSPEYVRLSNAFATRVEADGGIVEAIGCVKQAIQAFPQADKGRQIFDAYSVRVISDGGTVEGRECTINKLNELL